MSFSSITFLSVFLPAVLAVYYLAASHKNAVLLTASVLFYAWAEPRFLALLPAMVLITYFGGRALEKYSCRRIIASATICLQLSFLICFKYADFFIANVNTLIDGDTELLNLALPLGISFYTFRAVSYIIDVCRRDVKAQNDIYQLALYIIVFTQITSGPIVKYHEMVDQLDQRSHTFDNTLNGVRRFIIGLSKKLLIADILGASADKIFQLPVTEFDTFTAWTGSVFYTLQLYYDFAGYSDMAIGLSLIFGFKVPENFNYPYISKSITEFWRRWHISLSTWFKEYLYIPLGGNRVSKKRHIFNLLVVFFATGLWHGASWNFIVWGMVHGFFIIFEKLTGFYKETPSKALKTLQHIYTLAVVNAAWVLFRAPDLQYGFDFIKRMAGLGGKADIYAAYSWYVDRLETAVFAIAVIFAMPIAENMLKTKRQNLLNVWLIILFVLCLTQIASNTYTPFIYFKF